METVLQLWLAQHHATDCGLLPLKLKLQLSLLELESQKLDI
jgi:hypothetical protein